MHHVVGVTCPNCDHTNDVPVDNRGKTEAPHECRCGHVFWYDVAYGVID